MSTKELYKKVSNKRKRIESIIRNLKGLKEELDCLGIGDHYFTETQNDESKIKAKEDLLRQIDEMQKELISIENSLRDFYEAIKKLPDDYREIMELRYMQNLPWSQILLKTNRSRRWALSKQQKALCLMDIKYSFEE